MQSVEKKKGLWKGELGLSLDSVASYPTLVNSLPINGPQFSPLWISGGWTS